MKSWNGIRNNVLRAGSVIRFYVPNGKKKYYQQINWMNTAQKRNIANKD
jgi:hypothetical protein